MSNNTAHNFDSGSGQPAGKLSTNGHWIFGSVYAGLAVIGFSFGVWAGASKPKPVEVAEVKKDNAEKPADKPAAKPVVMMQTTNEQRPKEPEQKSKEPEPKPKEQKPKEPEQKPKEPEQKPKEPEQKPKEPEQKPKAKEPEPKKVDVKPVAFKEVSRVFIAYCNNCHGSVGKPKAGVDLRTVAAIMKGGDDGALVVPGDPEKSKLYLSITSGMMPPEGKPAPSPAELKVIHDWIASGAKQRRRPIRKRHVLRLASHRRANAAPLASLFYSESH